MWCLLSLCTRLLSMFVKMQWSGTAPYNLLSIHWWVDTGSKHFVNITCRAVCQACWKTAKRDDLLINPPSQKSFSIGKHKWCTWGWTILACNTKLCGQRWSATLRSLWVMTDVSRQTQHEIKPQKKRTKVTTSLHCHCVSLLHFCNWSMDFSWHSPL